MSTYSSGMTDSKMINSVRRAIPALTLILFASMAATTQVTASQIEPIFSKFTSTLEPGCAVLVIKDGKVVAAMGCGGSLPANDEKFCQVGINAMGSK